MMKKLIALFLLFSVASANPKRPLQGTLYVDGNYLYIYGRNSLNTSDSVLTVLNLIGGSSGVDSGGSGVVTLTGDVTGSGTSPIVTSIATGTIGATELASTGVTPGSYTNGNYTIDADGRMTASSNGTGVSSGTAFADSLQTNDGKFDADLWFDSTGKIDTVSINETQWQNFIRYHQNNRTWDTSPALTNGYILIGNGTNRAAGVLPNGDVTITNAGVTIVGDDSHLHTSISITNGTIRAIDCDSSTTTGLVSMEKYIAATGVINFNQPSPNLLEQDSINVWINELGATITIDTIRVESDVSSFAVTFYKTPRNGGARTVLGTYTCSTAGADLYYNKSVPSVTTVTKHWKIGFVKPALSATYFLCTIKYHYTRP
jgi:hypothetical protein